MKHVKYNFLCTMRRFLIEHDGAAASEYAVILGLIVVVVIGAAALFGLNFADTTTAVYSGLSNGTESTGGSFGPGTFRNNTTFAVP